MPGLSSRLDDADEPLTLSFKNGGRIRGREQMTGIAKKANEIANSFYSFTFRQTTGSLLSTRLAAMQRSLESIESHAVPDSLMSHLLTSLEIFESSGKERISIPLDDHVRHTEEEILEFLTVPYLDLSPTDIRKYETQDDMNNTREPLTPPSTIVRQTGRPPSILRRASSMVLNQNSMLHATDMQHCESVDITRRPDGIPTPLQPSATKQAVGQAVFTTSAAYPFAMKTLNDVACILSGCTFQNAQSHSFLDFVSPGTRDWLANKIISQENHAIKTRLCGELIEMRSRLMSVFAEESNKGVLMWVLEEVPAFSLENTALVQSLNGIKRIEEECNENICLQGESRKWEPKAIGAAVVLDAKTLSIIGYNRSALQLMLGLDKDITGKPFTKLIPQFSEFWPAIKHNCQTPGIVIPEHQFRHLAGIPYHTSAFIAPNPSRHAQQSIRAIVTDESESKVLTSTYVDIQLRVVTNDLMVAWLGYSHTSTSTSVDFMRKLFSVVSATPPHTPVLSPLPTPQLSTKNSDASLANMTQADYSDLMNVQVGENRRTLKFESFECLKLLGRGAYGEVRLVQTPSKKHVIVLKSIFKNRILVDTWSRDRVLGTIPNEIKILNQLRSSRHPNIVDMIDFFEDSEYYHMEMLPFGSSRAMDLFDYIESHSEDASPKYLFNIWQQVGSAVAHIHSIGIVHRDLKDENVIMDSYGNAKLIDFGSAAYMKQGPFDVFVGTVDYAAPEVIQGELYEGKQQDAWALGILLYIIMFKEPPFNGADEIICANLPDNMCCMGAEIIRLLLSKNPDSRPNVAEVLEPCFLKISNAN